MSEMDQLRIKTTAATLRTVSEWGLVFSGESDHDRTRDELRQIADSVDGMTGDDACCPVCEEVNCDADCPLMGVRDQDKTDLRNTL